MQKTITEATNVFDVAIEQYGDVEGIAILLADNPNLSIDSYLFPGDVLEIRSEPINSAVVKFFAKKRRTINTGDVKLPEAPSNLTAIAEGVGAIRLNWSDNSQEEGGYEVYRKVVGAIDYELAALLPADATTFLDSALGDGIDYMYEVVAVNNTGQSVPGPEVSAVTRNYDLELFFTANSITVDFVSSISQAVKWRLTNDLGTINTHTIGSSLVINNTGGAVSRFYFDSISNITSITTDDSTQLRGTVDLNDAFSSLLTFTSRNSLFILNVGTWVRQANAAIDVNNSQVTAENVVGLIDRLITANGGTVSDDGTNFTGTAGETHADRSLDLGTIELDLSDPANSVLFQKITALEAVGWTITTVLTLCNKRLIIDTTSSTYITSFFEKSRNLEGIEFLQGSPLNVLLYNTEAEAEAGGASGLLASGYASVDAWLRDNANYDAWVYGSNKGIRFEAVDMNTTNNKSIFSYKSFPSASRACGDNALVDYLGGNAKLYDGSSDYDEIDGAGGIIGNSPFSLLIHAFFPDFSNNYRYFDSDRHAQGAGQGLLMSINPDGGVTFSFNNPARSSSSMVLRSTNDLNVSQNNAIVLTYDGSGDASGVKIYINGISGEVVLDNSYTGTAPQQGKFTLGRFTNVNAFYAKWNLRTFEIINRVVTPQEVALASDLSTGGSFRAAGIPFDPSVYLLAPDFDKSNGIAPTTHADTPSFPISSFNGAEYTVY